jgi:hypothetical protein
LDKIGGVVRYRSQNKFTYKIYTLLFFMAKKVTFWTIFTRDFEKEKINENE